MSKFKVLLLLAFAAVSMPTALLAAEYAIDTAHSEVSFKIRHMGISKVYGRFAEFEGGFHYDADKPGASSASAMIQLASIDTDNEDRDAHLRSPDFFDVEKFPEMSFSGSKIRDIDEDGFKLEGELSLHGVTRPVVLDVELLGTVTDPWGNERAGFTATTSINRKDFDLTWNKVMEAGGLVVGDEVDITIEIEGIKS